MKNIYSGLLLMFLSSAFYGQNVITWCYQNNNSFDGITHHHSFLVGDLMTDSIAESEYYEINYLGDPYHSAHVRADSTGKVFATFLNYDPELPEILMYDYSLEVGDTMFYEYGGFPTGYVYEYEHFKVVIDKQNLFWDGKNHRMLVLESFGGFGYYESNYHEWIEGYGCLTSRGFTTPIETDIVLNGDSYSFNCVLENGTPVFSPANCYCNPHDNIDGLIVQEPEINIYNSTIVVESDESYLAEIFDITGKLRHKEFVNGSFKYNLQESGAGLFFIRLSGNDFVISKKFVVKS